MKIIVFIGFLILLYLSLILRTVVFHPVKSITYFCKDFYSFLKYKKWRNAYCGTLTAWIGDFGHGKTLSMVHHCVNYYQKYNDRIVFVPLRGWVLQKVNILSNVDLNIPYHKLETLQQIVDVCSNQRIIDEANNLLTYTYVIIDEASSQLNSREFKSNMDPIFLNNLLTCRHHHIILNYSSQKFSLVDKLLRVTTQNVIDCHKVWRIMCHRFYDAFDYENATNLLQVQPIRRSAWFIEDKHFQAYDTLACVGNLIKSCKEGDLIPENEIINNLYFDPTNPDSIKNPSAKEKKRRRKK